MKNQQTRPPWLPLTEALGYIEKNTKPICQPSQIATQYCLGRIVAEDIISSIDVPAFNNSSMDGYALRHADTLTTDTLQIVGESFAGHPYTGTIGEKECVRIMTGGVLPKGADTVVMQENVIVSNDRIELTEPVQFGESVRYAGSDIAIGQTLIEAGHKLNAVDVGLGASVGMGELPVYSTLRVAVLSTGDELLAPGQALKPGHIYDSNRYALMALLQGQGYDVIDMGIVEDDPDAIKSAFMRADQQADAVICSGGVSVGDADHVKAVLSDIGQVDFWKIAIKPGKPLAFGRLPNTVFIGLPGNSVSAVVTFIQVAQYALARLAGEKRKSQPSFTAIAADRFYKRAGRQDFQRALCFEDDSGQLKVRPVGRQNSAVLSTFSDSNCFAVLPLESADVMPGEEVTVQLYSYLM
ncbi:gephyrin-like molybdotransferase Glp [Alteromonas facilis]|uniref:molybdopterin molybdotransferase MoeA n=1 Tax=Alteromonas facilis TaxID=2048004 RepID=UPI000C286DEE|nr:gephyrin-like molybdotransferase Glp [Alteromonas facilis]